MGVCLCKQKARNRNSNNHSTSNNAAVQRQGRSGSQFEPVVDCVSEHVAAHNNYSHNQQHRPSTISILSSTGRMTKLSTMIDKLVLETLAVIRTLVDKWVVIFSVLQNDNKNNFAFHLSLVTKIRHPRCWSCTSSPTRKRGGFKWSIQLSTSFRLTTP